MDWDNYRIALALERAGSIRGAAQALGVNHATVSRRLAALDARLGARAFERVEGSYRPTDQGERLVAAALEMEEAVFAAERKAMGREQAMSGRLTLSLPEAVAQHLLIEDLGRFATRYPAIQLVLETSNRFADLDRREADVVVRVTDDPPDHLVGRRLFKYWRCQYCATTLLAGREPDAGRLQWLGWAEDPGRPDWVRDSVYPEAPVGLRIEDPLIRHAAAMAGLGMIFEACFLADPDPRLRRLPGARPSPDRDIWVLTHPDLRQTPRVAALLRHLADAVIAKRGLIEGRQPSR